ncbi:hypothetical protein LXL04_002736 [Taraxacum kok-saghyz]
MKVDCYLMIPDSLRHGIEVVVKLVIVQAAQEYPNLLFSGPKSVTNLLCIVKFIIHETTIWTRVIFEVR